jgi:hypothetical protein
MAEAAKRSAARAETNVVRIFSGVWFLYLNLIKDFGMGCMKISIDEEGRDSAL